MLALPGVVSGEVFYCSVQKVSRSVASGGIMYVRDYFNDPKTYHLCVIKRLNGAYKVTYGSLYGSLAIAKPTILEFDFPSATKKRSPPPSVLPPTITLGS